MRFVKKGEKSEPSTDVELPTTDEKKENLDAAKDEGDESDDDWFTVKKKPDALEQLSVDLPPASEKKKELSKTKLAKKLRKKNLLINKRVEYDDEGNVSVSN